MTKNFMFPKGALVVANEVDRAIMGGIKDLSLNLAALPLEAMYQLQDGVIAELRAREGHVL